GRVAPVPLFRQLPETLVGPGHQRAVRMLADELLVRLGGVGGLRRAPIALLSAATGKREQRDCKQRHECPGAHAMIVIIQAMGLKPGVTIPEEPKRRLSDRLGMSPTVISESTSIVGDVVTQGPLMVSGHVQGNGKVGGTLSVS